METYESSLKLHNGLKIKETDEGKTFAEPIQIRKREDK